VKLRRNALLVCGVILFVGLTLFFWTAANLTHLNCCSQEWVASASDTTTRDERTQMRAKSIAEVAKMRRRSQAYSFFCLAAAVSLATLHYLNNRAKCSKNRAAESRELC